MLFSKLSGVLKNPRKIVLFLDYKGILRLLPHNLYEKMIFNAITKKKLNLKNPATFNDKIIWLKYNWYRPELKSLVDKYLVREYIEKIGLGYTLNELYAVYQSVDEIDLSKLPDSFVLKVSIGSGLNIICPNKQEVDWKTKMAELAEYMKIDYYKLHKEWGYKDMKPYIVCEKFLRQKDGRVPFDYKILCFGGEPKIIQLDIDRFGNHRRNFYDADWNFLADVRYGIPNDTENTYEKPATLDEMLRCSRIIAKDLPFVRTDYYEVEGQVIFGEITFFPCAGYTCYEPDEVGLKIGSMIKLPPKQPVY